MQLYWQQVSHNFYGIVGLHRSRKKLFDAHTIQFQDLLSKNQFAFLFAKAILTCGQYLFCPLLQQLSNISKQASYALIL